MKRREFLALMVVAGAVSRLAGPWAAHAQQKMHRVGILLVGSAETMGPFREVLGELGYVEGRDVVFEVRSAEGNAELLPQLAAEIVRSRVDVIVASLTPAAIAAKNATRDIPVVMAPAGDPVSTGLIASLAHPGGNVTGVSGTGPELAAKNLEMIREVIPSASRVAVMGSAADPLGQLYIEQVEMGARPMQIAVRPLLVAEGELAGAFAAAARERADAVIVQVSLPVQTAVALAFQYRLPLLSTQKSMAKAGGLISYSASFVERGHEVAAYVDKIFKGAKPADLPVQQPTKFELTINLRTAKALGLTIPPTMLNRADEVIE
jgi:putative ABC transport system substrate-binding protein